jgi:hypothetical protein
MPERQREERREEAFILERPAHVESDRIQSRARRAEYRLGG